MKKITCTLILLGIALFFPVTTYANPQAFKCGGATSNVYAASDISISICHAPYTKFDLNNLDKWQPCVDAIIYITAKNGENTIYSDCAPDTYKEFKVVSNSLFVKHYYEGYPDFENKPLVVEEFGIKTKKSNYTLAADFADITKKQLEISLSELELELSKPFDGRTYFTTVYGAFNDVLAFSTKDPDYALKVLAEYKKRRVFDGEVFEALSTTIASAELIQKAIQMHSHE